MTRRTRLLIAAFSMVVGLPGLSLAQGNAQGNAVIRGKAGRSEIVITTTARVAGAVHSLTWDGKEFLDSTDHGRQLQSASNFDVNGEFIPETFNPTEAGSLADGPGPSSSSLLLRLDKTESSLQTATRMAFWLAPGETSLGHPAKNETVLSDHVLTKRVRIGHKGLPHAIAYDVVFTLPESEHRRHKLAQFEALTGYMPAEFRHFWTFDVKTGRLDPLDDGPGEQPAPVVFSTPDARHALGIYSPERPAPGYGRFRFGPEKVVKWNCVFRVRDRQGIESGHYGDRMFVAIGTLEDVRRTLEALVQEFAEP